MKHTGNHSVCRYENGTYCYDCSEFFARGTDEFLICSGIFEFYMVVRNISIDHPRSKSAKKLMNKIWLLEERKYETDIKELRDIEKESARFIKKYGKTQQSATIVMDNPECQVIFFG